MKKDCPPEGKDNPIGKTSSRRRSDSRGRSPRPVFHRRARPRRPLANAPSLPASLPSARLPRMGRSRAGGLRMIKKRPILIESASFYGVNDDTELVASPKGNRTGAQPQRVRFGKEEQGSGRMAFFSAKGKKNVGAKRTLLRHGCGGGI